MRDELRDSMKKETLESAAGNLADEMGACQLLKYYIRQGLPGAVLFFVFAGIFGLVFSLYDLEPEAVFYAACLCGLVLIPVAGLHFYLFVRRHRECLLAKKQAALTLEALPKPRTLAEEDYQQILYDLKARLDETITAWQSERQEAVDYYTIWVHQIKTPISVMRMILKQQDTREYRELSDEVFRIEQYVDMVLSYLRLGSQSSDYVIQEYRLDDIIRQAIHKYASQFVRKRIRLLYEPTDTTVLTDEKWLLFIIEQLLSNAVKYTQAGTVSISVTPDITLVIKDTGIGIAAEDLPRIFEKGFTGYNGRADKKSTGLGLYLCQMAARRLSASLRVESVVGEGTVFYVGLETYDLTKL